MKYKTLLFYTRKQVEEIYFGQFQMPFRIAKIISVSVMICFYINKTSVENQPVVVAHGRSEL
jgi:hypothetical protein